MMCSREGNPGGRVRFKRCGSDAWPGNWPVPIAAGEARIVMEAQAGVLTFEGVKSR